MRAAPSSAYSPSSAQWVRIEEPFQAVHVLDTPRRRLAVAAVGAALQVVFMAGHVPVADVDHVQDRKTAALDPAADGPLEKDPERPVLDCDGALVVRPVTAGVKVVAAVAEQHLRHDRVGQPQTAIPVQEEVVLDALRNQDEARLVLAVVGGSRHDRLRVSTCPGSMSREARCRAGGGRIQSACAGRLY